MFVILLVDMAVIESMHNYVNREKLSQEEIDFNLKIVEKVKDIIGCEENILPIVLLDEVEFEIESITSTDAWKYALAIGRRWEELKKNIPIDWQIWYESKFLEEGEKVIKNLIAKVELSGGKNFRMSQDGKSILSGSGKNRQRINLFQEMSQYNSQKDVHENVDVPSCEVLDFCCYLKKKEYGTAITVLPISFKGQQERVLKLAELADEKLDLIILYTKGEKVEEVFSTSLSGERNDKAEALKKAFL